MVALELEKGAISIKKITMPVLGTAEEEYARESLKVAENFLNANI
ncbi:unnamed protein product [marine sediment metagenome]|uniref:Uncharacterized protein n=1 Tax=marine sediment metagenome TaxID=412755 RepID=X1H0M1_9ZZZZ